MDDWAPKMLGSTFIAFLSHSFEEKINAVIKSVRLTNNLKTESGSDNEIALF